MSPEKTFPLQDVKVIDIGTLFAGPWIATYMADFGADVVKIEHIHFRKISEEVAHTIHFALSQQTYIKVKKDQKYTMFGTNLYSIPSH